MKKKILFAMLTVALAMFATSAVYAGTDVSFASGVTKVSDLLTGSGGKLVTLLAIVTTVVVGITGNIKIALGALGVALIASVGPSFANGFFTAVL